MIGKVLLTLAVIAIVIVVVKLVGSASGRGSAPAKAKPPELENKRADADDLEWDDASKTYRPRKDRDENRP